MDGGGISAIWGVNGGSNFCSTELQPTIVFLDKAQAYLNGHHLLASGGFDPDLTNLENVICKVGSALVSAVSVMVANGGWLFDKA